VIIIGSESGGRASGKIKGVLSFLPNADLPSSNFFSKSHPKHAPDVLIISEKDSAVKGRFAKRKKLCKTLLTNSYRARSRDEFNYHEAKNMPKNLSRLWREICFMFTAKKFFHYS
jgi:hypothetical protein